jgi:hypothetical protein
MSTSTKSGRQVERPYAGSRQTGQSFKLKTDSGRRGSGASRRGRGFWDVLG